jgi:hypothetical protein
VGAQLSWHLPARGQPGSEIEVVIGINRALAAGNVGDLLAGVLQFTDSFGHSRLDVPVSANVSSSAGLWVGGAAVSQVGQYLKHFQRDGGDQPVTGADGRYIVTEINTNLAAVNRTFPLRLIVHNPAVGSAVLLQRAYWGFDAATNFVVANSEAVLNRNLISQARRVSASHLPWTPANEPWPFDGRFHESANLTATVSAGFDDHASNPFLHSYHPDHDNLNATFDVALPQGSESYTVQRIVTLRLNPPADDFASLTSSDRVVTGEYLETITVLGLARAGGANDSRQFEVRGSFTLNRLSDVSALTLAP